METHQELIDSIYNSIKEDDKPELTVAGCLWKLFVIIISIPVGFLNFLGLAWAILVVWGLTLTQYDSYKPSMLAVIGGLYILNLSRLSLLFATGGGVKPLVSGTTMTSLITKCILWWFAIGLGIGMVYLYTLFV